MGRHFSAQKIWKDSNRLHILNLRLKLMTDLFPFRYTIKDLLEHELFQDEIGMKVELAKPMNEIPKGTQVIPMQLYLDDRKKRDLHKGDEAIAFEFMAGNDDPEEIAKEMVREVLIFF